MSTAELVHISTSQQGVRTVTLNRPAKRNAMSRELLDQFIPALTSADKDKQVKVIVITGNGPFFCAGADLRDIAALDGESARQVRYLEDLCLAMKAVRKPLVAAVNGPALGGGFELAMMCDLIFAANSAYFGLPEVQRGLIPGAGGTQRLTAAVGKFRAMRTILYGKPISSHEALAAGLVCETFEDVDILPKTLEAAVKLATNAPQAMSLAKEAICRADALGQDGDFEKQLYWQTFGTQEKFEGINMFLNKKSGGQ